MTPVPAHSFDHASRSPLLDAGVAAATGIAALALYIATLQPDLGGPEDTPKFQFVGYVLGTPHPPGYPLYVLLSHVFVALPIGTVAYRANLFSAVMAALACAIVYAIARQIGTSRWAAAAAALGLATGASYWRSAVFAEVYSLAAVMAALTTALLLRWGARGGPSRLLGAVAAFGVGLGNHLTLAGVLPAYVTYIFWRDRRAVTRRTVAAAASIMILCALQYGFIIVRSRQGAPYLESVAGSVPDLLRVMTAERYAGQRFAFGPTVLLTEHLPAVASAIGSELGWLGIALLVIGVVASVRRRNAGAIVVLGGAAGMLGMVLNLSGDLEGFITPVMALLWPIVALAPGEIRRVSSAGPRRSVIGMTASLAVMIAAAAIPLHNLARNYHDRDESGQTGEARFLRAMYRQLPDRAGIVTESYFYDMALHYLMLTGEEGPDRDIRRVTFDPHEVREAARGTGRFASPEGARRVFAFAGGATFFATDGLRFERAGVTGPPLEAWLRDLPHGAVIAGATAYAAVPFDLTAIDHPKARPAGRPRLFEAFALAPGAARDTWREGDVPVSQVFAAGSSSLGPRFAESVAASADATGARIEAGGRIVAHVATGLVLAVFTRDGVFSRALEFPSGGSHTVPFQAALYELTGDTACVEVREAWADVAPAFATGGWVATLPSLGSVTIETAVAGADPPRIRTAELLADGTARSVAGDPQPDGSATIVTQLTRTSERRPVFRLALDRVPVAVRARVRPGGVAATVKVCSYEQHPLFAAGGGDRAALLPDFESEAFFGAGWSDAERTVTGPVRRAGEIATLWLPLPGGSSYRLSLDLAGTVGTRMDVAANGTAADTCEVRDHVACEVLLPAAALRNGINAVTLTVRRPPGDAAPIILRRATLSPLR